MPISILLLPFLDKNLVLALPMELECWEASFQANSENGSNSESSTSRILCDSSYPMIMRWQADKNGSQASLFGGSTTQATVTSVSMTVCVFGCVCPFIDHAYDSEL